MNTNKIATGSTNKKLLAALAVLAVAFVVLAAVPAVASNSDAADGPAMPGQPSNTVTWDGNVTIKDNKVSAITPSLPSEGNGYKYSIGESTHKVTFTVSKDLTIIVANQFMTSLEIVPAEGVSSVNVYLVVPAEGTADGKDIDGKEFDGLMAGKYCTLTVDRGVNLVIDDQRAYPVTGNGRTIYNSVLSIEGNVWFKATGDTGRGSFDGMLVMNGGYLNLDGANSFSVKDETKGSDTISALTLTDSTITWNVDGKADIAKNVAFTVAGTTSIDKDSSITLTGATRMVLNTTLNVNGSVSAPVYAGDSAAIKVAGTAAAGTAAAADGSFAGKVAVKNSGSGSTYDVIDLSISSAVAGDTTNTSVLTATLTTGSSAKVTLSGNGTIGSTTVESGTLDVGSDALIASGATVSVNDGAILAGTVGYKTSSTATTTNSVKLENIKAGADGIKVSAGTGLTFTGNTQKADSSATTTALTVAGAVSLAGTTVIGDGVTLDVSAGKLTVPTGATLVFADTAVVKAPSAASSTAGITSAGTVALDKTTNSTASNQLVNAGVPATAQKTAYSIKAADASDDNLKYKDGGVSSNNSYTATLTVNSDAIADKASAAVTATIELDASASEGYKVEKVWYTVTTSSGTQTVTVKDKDAPVSDDDKYVLNLSSVQGDVLVYASVTGAYSAAFYVNGELYDSYTDVKPNTEITFPVYNASGYSWDKWYSDAAMTQAAAEQKTVTIVAPKASTETTADGDTGSESDGQTTTTASNAYVSGSVVYYGKAIASYAVKTDAADGSEITPEPVVAYQDQKVTVTVKSTDATKYRVSGLTITDASGNAVAYTPAFSADVTEYTFTMPASAVTVETTVVALYELAKDGSNKTGDNNSAPSANGTFEYYATEAAAKKAADGTAISTAAVGDVVYIKVTPSTGYALKALSYATVAGTPKTTDYKTIDITSDDIKVVAGDIYKITMPAVKLTVKAEFEQAYKIEVTTPDGTGAITANVKADQKNAVEKALVTITAPSVKDAKLTGLTVKYNNNSQTFTLASGITKVSDTQYTFVMPKYDVTITYEYSAALTIENVSQTGAGNMVGPTSGYKAVAKENLTYTDQSNDGISLKTITVVNADWTTSSTNTIYKVVYNVINRTAVSYTSDAEDAESSTFTATDMWKVDSTGDVYTFIMPAYNCTIAFDYGNTVYYTVTPVGNVELYYDEDLTQKVEDLTKVEYGTYYIKVVRTDNQDVSEASASYTHAVTTGTGDSAVTIPAGTFIPVSLIGELTSEQAEYSVLISVDTTITAVYKAHMTTVTIQTPTNGTLAVMNGTAAVQSGTTVPAGTTLTIVPEANDEYAVDKVYVNGTEVTTDGYTFVLGLENVTVSATFVPGYSITVTNPTGVSIDAPKTGYENQTVKVTYTEDGYTLQTLSVATSSGAVAATKVSGESAYTFVMPAGDVTITGTSQATGEQPVKASAVIVSLVYDPENNNAPSVMLVGVGGYVPAGTVTLTVYFMQNGAAASAHVTITVPEKTETNVVKVALSDGVSEVSATTVAAVASYTGGDLTARTTGFQGFVATLTASAATQE